jgi:hypothetical protein
MAANMAAKTEATLSKAKLIEATAHGPTKLLNVPVLLYM